MYTLKFLHFQFSKAVVTQPSKGTALSVTQVYIYQAITTHLGTINIKICILVMSWSNSFMERYILFMVLNWFCKVVESKSLHLSVYRNEDKNLSWPQIFCFCKLYIQEGSYKCTYLHRYLRLYAKSMFLIFSNYINFIHSTFEFKIRIIKQKFAEK